MGMTNPIETIDLTPTECRIANHVGKLRNSLSLKSKTNLRRDPAQSDEDMNIQAVAAEIAVAKYLNVYPEISPTDGDLPRYDCRFRDYRIEVKRNHLSNGDLLVPHLDKELIYILVCGEIPMFLLIGYLPGSSISLLGKWVELTYGACWKVKPNLLISLANLGRER